MIDPDYDDGHAPIEPSFFFYDLETSGLSPREDRIMQFAGIRTDMEFNQIGEPVNILVKLTEDTLPSPGAINVTKITPQQTQADGLTEAEFCKFVHEEIFTPGTCACGYNSIRFDDEFMRYTFWRNFYDPYEWQWKNDRSRWDLLDVVRLTRALRPEGINWPVVTENVTLATDENGAVTKWKTVNRATNRLELLTKENHIEHKHAHDALSDVEALISVTKLIHDKQPQLYNYLFKMRNKNEIKKLVNLDNKRPFVYACGRYSSANQKTTVAFPLTAGRNGNVLVFDLRYNLEELLEQEKNFKPDARKKKFSFNPMVKELAYNKCPAVSPISVLDSASTEDSNDAANPMKAGATGWDKIGLTRQQVEDNLRVLLAHPEFAERMREEIENTPEWPAAIDDEAALYDGFLPDNDRTTCAVVRAADANKLADFHPMFTDARLESLLLHYKAKNFPTSLTENEQTYWEIYRTARLARQEKTFMAEWKALKELADQGKPGRDGREIDQSILEDLMLWYQSLASADLGDGSLF